MSPRRPSSLHVVLPILWILVFVLLGIAGKAQEGQGAFFSPPSPPAIIYDRPLTLVVVDRSAATRAEPAKPVLPPLKPLPVDRMLDPAFADVALRSA